MEALYVLAALALGYVTATIAERKGHSFGPWFLYGALLAIVALPHALLSSGGRHATPKVRERLMDEVESSPGITTTRAAARLGVTRAQVDDAVDQLLVQAAVEAEPRPTATGIDLHLYPPTVAADSRQGAVLGALAGAGRCTYDELAAQVDLDDERLADTLDVLLDEHLVDVRDGLWGLTRAGEVRAPTTSSGTGGGVDGDRDLEARLVRLKRLRESDLISESEYDEQKRRLLEEL